MSSAFIPLRQDNNTYDSLIKFLGSSENVLNPSGASSTKGLESIHLEEDRTCLHNRNGKSLLQRELFLFFEGKEGRTFCMRIAVTLYLFHLFLESTTPCSCDKDNFVLIPFQKISAEREGIKWRVYTQKIEVCTN